MPPDTKIITLYHVTPNMDDIDYEGRIRTDKAQGTIKAIWLVAETKIPWAVAHVSKRHNVASFECYVYEVKVPRKWLKRWRRKARGVWYCMRDIPESRFTLLGLTVLRREAYDAILKDYPF